MLTVLVAMAGCAGPSTSMPASVPPSLAPASAEASTGATATPLPGLPAELVGEWETDLTQYLDPDPVCPNCGAETRLLIRAHGQYVVAGYGPFRPGGAFSVEDGLITFARSSRAGETACESATYSWELDGERLTFTALAEDPCGRRGDALDGVTYTRAE
jgi:hypothetical protein